MLVVDDLVSYAQSLGDLLQIWGCHVELAHDGASAIIAAKEFHPQVALLDINMPEMNGYQAARLLREEHGAGLLIVAITGYGQAHDREAALSSGFDEHLVKPADPNLLRETLEKLMSNQQLTNLTPHRRMGHHRPGKR